MSRFDAPNAGPTHWPTDGVYFKVDGSPEFDQLIASELSLDSSMPHMALIDVDTGNEHALELTGTDAAWGADGRIWYHREMNSLWVANGPHSKPERVLWSDAQTNGEFHDLPRLSHDGEWMAWSFIDGDDPRIVLLDTVTRTYRLLDDYWYDCGWVV